MAVGRRTCAHLAATVELHHAAFRGPTAHRRARLRRPLSRRIAGRGPRTTRRSTRPAPRTPDTARLLGVVVELIQLVGVVVASGSHQVSRRRGSRRRALVLVDRALDRARDLLELLARGPRRGQELRASLLGRLGPGLLAGVQALLGVAGHLAVREPLAHRFARWQRLRVTRRRSPHCEDCHRKKYPA